KVSQFRELSRLRREWLEHKKPITGEPRFGAFSRALMMLPEHTWGMDIKMHLNDYEHYARDHFNTARTRPNFQKFQSSPPGQRDYLKTAVDALGDTHEGQEARHRLARIVPIKPNIAHFQQVSHETVFETPHFTLGIDPASGAINRLVHKATNHEWASPDNLLA